MWTNAIEHAAWLVRGDEDTPPEVLKVRCEAANTIKRQWDAIKALTDERDDAGKHARLLNDDLNALKAVVEKYEVEVKEYGKVITEIRYGLEAMPQPDNNAKLLSAGIDTLLKHVESLDPDTGGCVMNSHYAELAALTAERDELRDELRDERDSAVAKAVDQEELTDVLQVTVDELGRGYLWLEGLAEDQGGITIEVATDGEISINEATGFHRLHRHIDLADLCASEAAAKAAKETET